MSCVAQDQIDIEDIGKGFIPRYKREKSNRFAILEKDKKKVIAFSRELCSIETADKKVINKTFRILMRKYRVSPSKYQIRMTCKNSGIDIPDNLQEYLIKNKARSMSGIVSIGVSMPPLNSCSYNCSFCPTPLDSNNKLYVPKSYDEKEGAIARGLRNNWVGHYQVYERGNALIDLGHIMDKLEMIVRGGTFHCYPERVQIKFITELYYGANTFYDQYENKEYRDMLSLDEEVEFNKTSKCRIIGLTLETRPDFAIRDFSNLHLYPDEKNSFIRKRLYRIIKNLRRFGCTRIEFGIQHTDNDILANVNRDGTIEDAIYSIKLMKDCCFKIVGHWMPDLPGSSYDDDLAMMNYVIYSQHLQLDDWKIYPTATTNNTEIFKWYKDGSYKPYSETNLDQLINLCIIVKRKVPKWIRIDRLTRDIPSTMIEVGYQGKTNLRQIIQAKMKEQNYECNCLRCKEVKGRVENIQHAKLCVNQYKASDGDECFISMESCSCKLCWCYYLFLIYQLFMLIFGIRVFWKGCKNYNILYGFCRLRLSKCAGGGIFRELQGSSLIRELKVYGQVVPHFKTTEKKICKTQHNGFGKKLMRTAETISRYNRYKMISVINGVGTEEYYVNKLGYQRNNNFVSKIL